MPTSIPAQDHDKVTQGSRGNDCMERLDDASSWKPDRGDCACALAARAAMRRLIRRSGPTDSESSCAPEAAGGTAHPDSRRPTPGRRSKPGEHSCSGSRSSTEAAEAAVAADAAKASDSSERNSAGSGEGRLDATRNSPSEN